MTVQTKMLVLGTGTNSWSGAILKIVSYSYCFTIIWLIISHPSICLPVIFILIFELLDWIRLIYTHISLCGWRFVTTGILRLRSTDMRSID